MNRLLALLIVLAVQAGSAPAPATYKTATDLATTLGKSLTDRATGMGVAPVASGARYGINLVTRTKPAGAIAHPLGSEVHYITAGSATFVTGGTIVHPAGGGPAIIENGVSRHVAKGDVIFIPAGTPHWYSQIDGASITYLETRFEVGTN
jgi:mannose-6-phosphate isomerase-like protein (cupin superfamily)